MEVSKKWLSLVLSGLLVILIVLNLFIGASFASVSEFFKSIVDPESSGFAIIMYLRLPRTIACILVGAALSVSGLLLQTMLNNSLAAPGTIGINSGAGLAVVVSSIFLTSSAFGLTISTFIGAFLSSMLIYGIARATGASRNKLILAGIAISRLFSALIDAIVYLYPSALVNKTTFQLGSFAKIDNNSLIFAGIFIIIGLIGALILSRYLSVLSLGDEIASSLGMNVKLIRFLLLLDVAILSAGAVSIAGLLSFLGLIIPHIVRRLIGVENQKRLTRLTILSGSVLTLLCDLLSRTIFIPFELPVGIIMSLIGIPFFIYLLFNKKGQFRVAKNK